MQSWIITFYGFHEVEYIWVQGLDSCLLFYSLFFTELQDIA